MNFWCRLKKTGERSEHHFFPPLTYQNVKNHLVQRQESQFSEMLLLEGRGFGVFHLLLGNLTFDTKILC